jgi:hypothetical protein
VGGRLRRKIRGTDRTDPSDLAPASAKLTGAGGIPAPAGAWATPYHLPDMVGQECPPSCAVEQHNPAGWETRHNSNHEKLKTQTQLRRHEAGWRAA